MMSSEQVVLVIGACGLDRLHTVATYPSAEEKIVTTSYHEIGGGNAANTASAMALLSTASFLSDERVVKVKLCAKIGDDHIGRQLVEELETAGVDLSSPLFRIGQKETSTGFTTVIVSESEQTRTCIHTPGTCGELRPADVEAVDMDQVFQNVVHLHSDCRHTDAALLLAREARKRGIPVSVDVEKDRKTKALDDLIVEATMIFTNSLQIEDYLARLTRELEHRHGRQRLNEPDVVAKGNSLSDSDMELYATVIRPSAFFTRWYGQQGKQVVITKGHLGAVHVVCNTVAESEDDGSLGCLNEIKISADENASNHVVHVRHKFVDHSDQTGAKICSAEYLVRTAGVLSNLTVVDTTGAGDAFIGGFILGTLYSGETNHIESWLRFGSWVGGRKLEGPGARSALPAAHEADEILGREYSQVQETLCRLVSPFLRDSSDVPSPPGGTSEAVERSSSG